MGTATRWDVSAYFASLDSREFAAAEERAGADVDRLVSLYDRHDVRGGERTLDERAVAAFDEVVRATNDVHAGLQLLNAYVHAHLSTDARDATAQAAMSRLQQLAVPLSTLATRFDAWCASLGDDRLVAASDEAAAHEWPVRKAARRAERQMSEAEESLAAALDLTGRSAWARLYQDVTAGITTTVALPDGPQDLPIFAVRGLATDARATVRRAAYDAELTAWQANAVPIAAALNAIKGEQQTLALRRGWPSVLDAQLYGQSVDRATLDAMQSAMVASFPDFRRYLRSKASLLSGGGEDQLAFWDLFAPVGDTRPRSWDEAQRAVDEAFAFYSPQLQALARRAFEESWIDVEPRAGKQGGAFCMPMGDGASRVLLNFSGSVDAVMTLAHELGHAYHNSTMTERTPLQRGTPSSLAETASIFCETIMVGHGIATARDDQERLAILEVDLQGATQVIVDIHSRFLFESAVFDRRARSTLSVPELCELMAEAQEQTYGNGLHRDRRHPWMWAAKPHYYGSLFYNWPYAFGLLFGLGLYARYQEDPERFRHGYDDLLSSTGLGQAADLAGRFDIDVRDEGFWTASLDVVRGRIDDFCRLTADSTSSRPPPGPDRVEI
jgi:oligoendopeptidase F